MPNLENYYIANDKGLLAEHLVKHQILTPKSFLMKAGEKFDGIKNLSFPILTKPTLGFSGGEGIFKFNNIEQTPDFEESGNIFNRGFLTTGRQGQAVSRETPVVRQHLANPSGRAYMRGERLARVSASPTRSGPEGSSRNEPRLGRCPASHFFLTLQRRRAPNALARAFRWHRAE